MLPSDQSDLHDEIDPEHLLGRFDPRDAQRILKRLKEEHVSFRVEECSQVVPDSTRYRRRSSLCIYVRPEDQQKAEAISLEDVQP